MKKTIHVSAPCRVDLGGTLDISAFYYALKRYRPATFNIALNSRTYVSIASSERGTITIDSKGFEPIAFKTGEFIPYTHPMGMMAAICDYFDADGVSIKIHSTSPGKSALGGSSVAALALTCGFMSMEGQDITADQTRHNAVKIVHSIETMVAGIPCGIQDQLAAAFGGVNLWQFHQTSLLRPYSQNQILSKDDVGYLNQRFIVAYCGRPHNSGDINSRWVNEFRSGKYFHEWIDIVHCANEFSEAIRLKDYDKAVKTMNRETDIRLSMTPDVFDPTGQRLMDSARDLNCGGRFAGAGGGGCVWAVGKKENIQRLKEKWHSDLDDNNDAFLLDSKIDTKGVSIEEPDTLTS